MFSEKESPDMYAKGRFSASVCYIPSTTAIQSLLVRMMNRLRITSTPQSPITLFLFLRYGGTSSKISTHSGGFLQTTGLFISKNGRRFTFCPQCTPYLHTVHVHPMIPWDP